MQPDDAAENRWPHSFLRWVQDHPQFTALGLFGLAYFLGVMSWGWHARLENLGFLHLSPVQYLSAGFYALLCLGLILTFYFIVAVLADKHLAPQVEWKKFGDLVIIAVIQLIAIVGASWLGLFVADLVGDVFGFLSLEGNHLLFLSVLISGPPILWELMMFVYQVVARRRAKRATVIESQHWERPPTPRPPRLMTTPGRTAGSIGMWTLMALLLSSTALLPAMAQEFGGARPRSADFDLRLDELSNETRSWILLKGSPCRILAENASVNASLECAESLPTVRSVTLKVLVVGPDYYLIARPEAAGKGNAVHLPKSTVTFVYWAE